MTADKEVRLRIVVIDPPVGVRLQMQRGRQELVPPVRTSKKSLTFEFTLRVGTRPSGEPNFLGEFAQGPPAGRFVYVNAGTLAGESESCWSRRAKIPLATIAWPLIRKAQAVDGFLEVHITGTGRDGGPTCGTVRLESGWQLSTV